MNETELLPMHHTMVVVNSRIVVVAAVMKGHAHPRNPSITHTTYIAYVMQLYAWTLMHNLRITNNHRHHLHIQVIFTLTILIQIRAKELLLLSILSHIYVYSE